MVTIYKQIPNLPASIGLSGLEELEVVQGGVSVRSSVDQISSLVIGRVFALPMPPTGAAGGDLIGSYPNPLIRPSTINGQVLTTVAGVSTWATPAPSGGTVTSVVVLSANGLDGVVLNPTTTPTITLRTTVTGLLKGDGTAISAAVAGTDYVTPGGLPTSLPPSGPASGDLTGTYPAPTIKNSVALAGSPTTTTQVPATSNTTIATTAFVTAAVAASPAGTVTSVAVGTGLSASPSPIVASGTISLANTAVTPGTYGNSTNVGQFTVDQQGRLTFAGNVAIVAGGSGTVTSLTASTGITLTPSPITTTGSIAIANTAVAAGTYGSATQVAQFTVDGQGRLTFAGNVTITGGGTVTSVSVVSANGLAGTVATATTTPAITLSTTITGLLKGNGTAISAAVAGTDYLTPGGAATLYQPLDTGLTVLSSIGTGLVANTAADAFSPRTITGTAGRISVINGNGVSGNPTIDIDAAYAPPATLAAGAVGYGSAGNLLTGVLANLSFDATNMNLGVGKSVPTSAVDIVSTTNNKSVFNAVGVANATTAQTWFHVSVADPTGGSGSSFKIDGGTTGGLALFDIDRSGDALVSGWMRILSQTALAAGGRYYMGLYIGNGSGGNTGLYAGTGAPTLDTFGTFGSLYMDASTPGVPYYNSNGTTGWTRLAPITHVGTTAPSPAIDNALWFNSDAAVGGGQLYIRYNDGSSTAWVPTSSGVGSTVLQTVSFQTGALIATAPGYIPWDDTIPQQTEGNEYMILAITPKSASSRLEIDVLFTYACGASNVVTIALFRDAAADALVATSGWTSAPDITNELKLTHVVASGSTASTTFKVRGGPTTGGPGITVNGVAGARKLGGVSNTAIVIREVL